MSLQNFDHDSICSWPHDVATLVAAFDRYVSKIHMIDERIDRSLLNSGRLHLDASRRLFCSKPVRMPSHLPVGQEVNFWAFMKQASSSFIKSTCDLIDPREEEFFIRK
jgi:hypothetical protein